MSARLNVVIVQSPRMTTLQGDITEQVMIELLGRPGLDLLIVQSLVNDETSTDHLAVTALESDIAIVDWQSEETIISRLAALGLAGVSAAHELNPQPLQVSSASTRRFYCFDLKLGFKPSQVSATIAKLLAAKQVRTVSIGNLAPLAPGRLPTSSRPESMAPQPIAESVQTSHGSLSAAPSPSSKAQPPQTDEDQLLDRLVDGLNDAGW